MTYQEPHRDAFEKSAGWLTRRVAILFTIGLCASQTILAQPRNEIVFQRLAVECFGALPEEVTAFKVTPPQNLPFVRSALVSRWTAEGRRVFLSDSVYTGMPDRLAHFTYRAEQAGVRYERLRKKRAMRTIDLTLTGQLATASGEVLLDDVCRRHYADTLTVADLKTIETRLYPETYAPHPPPGWVRRALEPVVLSAATIVGAYLFFTLRSDSSDDGS